MSEGESRAPAFISSAGDTWRARLLYRIRIARRDPTTLIGLVLAGFFSHTMAMVSSDANVISSVVTRDIAPRLVRRVRDLSEKGALTFARITTFTFVAISMVIAISTEGQGVVLKIVIDLVAATMGPISIPLMLGLLPWFRRSGPTAALVSWAAGLGVWAVIKWVLEETSQTMVVGVPLVTSLVLYVAIGLLRPERTAPRDELIDSLDTDPAPETEPVSPVTGREER